MGIIDAYFEELKRNWRAHLLTLVAYASASAFASYMFRVADTAPAVVLAPQGIALAAALLMGYSILPVIGLTNFVVSALAGNPLPLAFLFALANMIQPALILYVLKRFNVNRNLKDTWDFYIYIGVAFVGTMIVPTINSFGRAIYNNNFGAVTQTVWTDLWIAGLLSAIVLTPLIVRIARPVLQYSRIDWIEGLAAITILNVVTAVLTYTPRQELLGISLILPFAFILLWIALRGGTFFVTLAMFTVSVSAISGRILGHPANPQNLDIPGQIVAAQTSLIVFTLLYYFIAALEESRRGAVRDLKRYTSNLEQTVEQRELDAAAKNEFISVLGHEIRNPLASMLSSVELMKITKGPEQARILEGMEDRIRSMGRLLDDIFDISRITRQKLLLKKQTMRARDVLRKAVDQVSGYMSKNKHRFLATLPDKNVLIYADPVRVEQITTNLLYNAAKYTPAGGYIEFKANFERKTGSENSGYLVMRVKDTGVGLSEEEQDRIFEPFMQINPRQSIMGGIGLGLTLAKNLVELHDGTIEVQSDGLGRGSEFIVRLPAEIGMVTPAPKKEAVFTPLPPEESTTILVVDDNADAAKGLGKLLEFHGHTVALAHLGEEAVVTATKLKPETIVLDIGLPDIDGFEVARKLRAAGNKCTLIALSGYGREDHRRKAREVGFNFYLTKPVSVAEVLSIVQKTQRGTSESNPSGNKTSRVNKDFEF